LYYATALTDRGYASGVLVESHMGRPTKVEGNPRHPASLGATDVWMQGSILELYDPGRSRVVKTRYGIATWEGFLVQLARVMDEEGKRGGRGLRLLTGRISSPSLLSQIESLLAEMPEARWHAFEPAGRENVREGSILAFGRDLEPHFDFGSADVVLSLDCDFLYREPGHLRYAREFASRRRAGPETGELSRLYVVETTPTLTGAMADHRLARRPSEMEAFARSVAARIGVQAAPGSEAGSGLEWIDVLASDLMAHRGRSLVLAGEAQSPSVHAIAHAMNDALGNLGATVRLRDASSSIGPSSLQDLVSAIDLDAVAVLITIGVNPAYSAPADFEFGELSRKVNLRVHMGLYEDETAVLSHWHLPMAHELESWGDARAFEGTVSLQQPLIAPLYQGRTPGELLEALSPRAREAPRASYDILRDTWRGRLDESGESFERLFRAALHEGLIPGTEYPEAKVRPSGPMPESEAAPEPDPSRLEIVFRPDPTIGDGRHYQNAWLQELPKPLTQITWDNAAILGVRTAERLGVESCDVVEVAYRGRSLEAPVWVLPGQAESTVTLHLGYGGLRAGELAERLGFDAYRLRTSDAPWRGSGVALRPKGTRYPLATTQGHDTMEGRPIVLHATLEELRRNPAFAREAEARHPEETLYPKWEYEGYAWGMAIDLSTCIGCKACVIACQAENNIPVVGKSEVLRQREMHWIRVDRYYRGDPESPEVFHQPVPCMHCENAPCEVVCPVAATVHSQEGLNEMVYNRCVGTRYCSNNCPYKVRRFNFFNYGDQDSPVLELLRNPDVTVRGRGVMEKCTYCVQRISAARIEAKKQDRRLADGDVTTACQQACPADAIIFGDVNDPASRVARLKAGPRNYALLAQLNTRPRTTYLAKITHPNPEIKKRT
ncbi:MAG: 4Fe-4S dicluster domain-containing protein, partial [Vicinamibacteria bacterium]